MLNYLERAYKEKKVFLTGHTGFKGSWLLKLLHTLGAKVKGYALSPENENDLYYLINGNALCTSVINDVRNRQRLAEEVLSFEPDYVFHLAAQPLVRLSYQIPAETFEVNAVGPAYLLDAVHLLPKPCQVVLITTDKVYHNNEWIYPYRENDRLGGYDPYSASKACAELVIDSYKNSFFNLANYDKHKKAIAVARAGNVIGGGDWNKDRLLPDIARALGSKSKIIIRNPSSVRPWQHVLEPLTGYLLLGAKLSEAPASYSQAYNFGPFGEDALSVENMVRLAIEQWGSGTYKVMNSGSQPHEAGLLKLDISKAIGELNWKPQLNASEALALTINWYKQYFTSGDKIDAFTAEQIERFFTYI